MTIPVSKKAQLLILLLVTSLTTAAQNQSAMPRIEGKNLAGAKLVFPDAAAGHRAVLIFGFTRASKAPTS
jgi:hypothetical protein